MVYKIKKSRFREFDEREDFPWENYGGESSKKRKKKRELTVETKSAGF